MKTTTAVRRLAALAQDTRLAALRALVRAGEAGLPAGTLAAALGVSAPALSFHLKELAAAGLVRARQQGRYVIYTAEFAAMRELVDYLTDDCCGGAGCELAPRPVAPRRRSA